MAIAGGQQVFRGKPSFFVCHNSVVQPFVVAENIVVLINQDTGIAVSGAADIECGIDIYGFVEVYLIEKTRRDARSVNSAEGNGDYPGDKRVETQGVAYEIEGSAAVLP